jgi:hypothetical protein
LEHRTKATEEHIGVQKPKLPRAILRRKRAEWVRLGQGGVQEGAEEHSVEGHSKASRGVLKCHNAPPLVELFLCYYLLMLMAVCRWKEDDKVGTREIESEAFSELWSQREIFKSLKLMDSHFESFISPPPHIPPSHNYVKVFFHMVETAVCVCYWIF